MEALSTAITTAMGTVATDALGAITSIVPVAAPVLGGIIVIGIAIKTIKRFTGR